MMKKKLAFRIAVNICFVVLAVIIFVANGVRVAGTSKTISLEESDLVGTWRSDTGNTTDFYQDGKGKTEGDDGIYAFTWKITSSAVALETPRAFRVFEYTKILSDSASDYGISWGIEDIAVANPNDWNMLGYVLSLTFDGIDYKFDFAFILDEQDNLIINTGPFGQRLSPEQDLLKRLEWVTFTKEN